MKAIVTGGAGFIGSHIVDALVEKNVSVAVVDDLSTGKKENLNPAAKFYNVDICGDELEKIILNEKPDIIFHQAAQISVSRSVREPAFDAKVNLVGAISLLESCVKAGVGKVVFSSSGGTVYGEVPGDPANESTAFSPLSPYGISKMCFEYYLNFYNYEHGLKYTTLRYGNVFGPRQDPHGEAGVVAIFSKLMLKGAAPKINGDGMYYRDYVYVKDVAAANLKCIDAGDCEAINIGTGRPTNVVEIYEEIKKATGFEGEAEFGPARPGDLRRSVLDIAKAAKTLDWKPAVTFEQGIENTVDFFRTSGD